MANPTYDRNSILRIAIEDMEKGKFFIDVVNKIAVRVGNEEDSPLYTVPLSLIRDINIVNIDAQNDGVEYEHIFTPNTKAFSIKTRKTDVMRIAFIQNGTTSNKYVRVGKGSIFSQWNMRTLNLKVYINLKKGNNTIEIIEYL